MATLSKTAILNALTADKERGRRIGSGAWVNGQRVETPLCEPSEKLVSELNRFHDIAMSLRLPRWIYCKYCRKNVLPALSPEWSIIICSECEYGLYPTDTYAEDYPERVRHSMPPRTARSKR
jgi:hypothetical protein